MKTIIFYTLLLLAFFLVSSNETKAQYCTYTLTATSAEFSASGGQGSFSVTDYDFCAWQAVSNVDWIIINSGSGSGTGQITYTVQPNASSVARTGTISIAGKTFVVNQAAFVVRSSPAMFDFDGDKKTDIGVYRPSEARWHVLRSQAGYQQVHFDINVPSDYLAPADYDGDGKTDHAWTRNHSYQVFESSSLLLFSHAFSIPGDIPVPGDWDGDGKADIAVYRAGANPGDQSYFYYRGTLNNPQRNITFIPFGQRGDIPVIGDYDGDGKQDATIFRPSVGEWWILRSSDGTNRVFQFGQNGDKPLSGDFTGDGKTDIAVFRPATAEWFILRSEDNSYYAATFGAAGDIPVVGDYDGDGRDDIAVYRPSNGTWYIMKSFGGITIVQFGLPGDKPIPAAYVP